MRNEKFQRGLGGGVEKGPESDGAGSQGTPGVSILSKKFFIKHAHGVRSNKPRPWGEYRSLPYSLGSTE